MVSITLLYEEKFEPVRQLWKSSAKELGFRSLDQDSEAHQGSWDTFALRNTEVFFGAGPSRTTDHTWVELFSHGCAYVRYREVFERLLKLPLSPTEAVLLDHDNECTGPLLGFLPEPPQAEDLLRALLQNSEAGMRQLRATSLKLLPDLEPWTKAAQNLGIGSRITEKFLRLDVHWDECGKPIPEGVYRIALCGPYS